MSACFFLMRPVIVIFWWFSVFKYPNVFQSSEWWFQYFQTFFESLHCCICVCVQSWESLEELYKWTWSSSPLRLLLHRQLPPRCLWRDWKTGSGVCVFCCYNPQKGWRSFTESRNKRDSKIHTNKMSQSGQPHNGKKESNFGCCWGHFLVVFMQENVSRSDSFFWFLSPRLSAGQRVSDETLQALSTTSVLRPHPPPPLCHPKPRPPSGVPPSKTSASFKLITSSSLSRTQGQHRSTSASTGPRKPQTPACTRIATPEPGSDQRTAETTHRCTLSPEQESAALHCRTLTSSPGFQIKTPRNSLLHDTRPLSHRSTRSPSRECDLSPQTERKSSPAWRSRRINTIPSSPHCDAGSYSSNSTDHSVSPTGKSKAHNGRQNSTCGVSTAVQTDNDRRKSTSESFHSCVGSKKKNNGLDRSKNVRLGKDVTQQQSLVATSHGHPASVRINGQFFTSPKRPPEGTTSQPESVQDTQKELELIKFYQPVPPARVSTWSPSIIS